METPFHSAHSVTWEADRHCLWALGFDELRRYELRDWDTGTPSLELTATHRLPDADGHDLRTVPHSADLLISTAKSTWLFDRDKGEFRPHPQLAGRANVKSVDVHPKTGRLVVSEWSSVLRLFSPDGQLDVQPARPYKARWLPE